MTTFPRIAFLIALAGTSALAANDFVLVKEPPSLPKPQAIVTPFDPFSIQPEYRRFVLLDASALSPFRKPEARAAQAAGSAIKTSGPNISAVLSKFQQLGLTGIIPSTPRRAGLIILGGNIFREGQELCFTEPKSRGTTPMLAEHKVMLRSVTAQALALWVSHLNDTGSAPLNVPIALLEFRQR